jgi:hypothetical protein
MTKGEREKEREQKAVRRSTRTESNGVWRYEDRNEGKEVDERNPLGKGLSEAFSSFFVCPFAKKVFFRRFGTKKASRF